MNSATPFPEHPGRPGPETTAKLRQYGLQETGHPKGPPVAKPLETSDDKPKSVCPHCGCEQLMEITIRNVKMPQLRGGKGIGHYIGCPACPWASPMVVAAKTPPVYWQNTAIDLSGRPVRRQRSPDAHSD